jgi:methyl-accepting chemotaxis protein
MMAMTNEEIEKRKLLYEVEQELWTLLKRRAWLLIILGVGGLWAIVHWTVQQVADRPLKEVQKQLVQAEVQADGAKRSAAAAGSAADQVTTSLGTLQGSVQGLRDQAKAVEDQFALVSQQINAASENAARRSQRDFNAVQQRIAGLEALVKKIGDENDATRKATADYAKQVAALETKIEREQKRFAENSEYTVSISHEPSKKALAAEVQSRLASTGFRATVRELMPNIIKGNSLTFQGPNEAKAQEVLALLKPVVRDLQAKKPLEYGSKMSDLKGSTAINPLVFWHLDPKGMQLLLGAD